MGVCGSCQATAVSTTALVSRTATAKLVLEDGGLQEFESTVKVYEVLRQSQGGGGNPQGGRFFVCDADVMGTERVLSAMVAEDELKPGQLYFLLPVSMLRRPFRPHDMAELVVKASSALIRHSGVLPLVFPAAGVDIGFGGRRGVVESGRTHRRDVKWEGNRRLSNLDLSSIPENADEEDTGGGRLIGPRV